MIQRVNKIATELFNRGFHRETLKCCVTHYFSFLTASFLLENLKYKLNEEIVI